MNLQPSICDPHFSSSDSRSSIGKSLITLESLPPELQIDVLSFLDPVDLIKTCRTCKKLRVVGLSDKLWKDFIQDALSFTPILSSTESEPPDLAGNTSSSDALSVHTPNGIAFFPGAYSYYEIFLFVRLYSDLLGFWQGDLPSFGKTIRITFVPQSSQNVDGPSFLCQEVRMTNRLIDANWQTWKEITSFELGRSIVTGIGVGDQLERWNEFLKVDLCSPKMVFSDLWKVDWKAFINKLRNPVNRDTLHSAMNRKEANLLWRKRSHGQASTPTSPSISSSSTSASQECLSLSLERIDLYHGVEQEYHDWKQPTEHGSLPYRFPTPSALPAFSTVECESDVGPSSGANSIKRVTPYNFTHQAASAGTRVKINRLTMNPDPPPYHQTDRATHFHMAYSNKPLSFFPLKSFPRNGLRVLPDWNEERQVFDHQPPAPKLDPSHMNFDWESLEGLYGVSYGPHGVELIYIRTRFLVEEDFDRKQSQDEDLDQQEIAVRPDHWPEPSMQDPVMYSAMAISKSSVKPGVRVLEGVKISGDPHVPRGSVSFRAFLDDPSCVSIPWRAPPSNVRNHLPFPHRTDEKTSNASMLNQTSSSDIALAPGYLTPAHGRIAEFGFVEKTWFPAQMHISSPDEIRLWWHNMGAVAVAHRLIA